MNKKDEKVVFHTAEVVALIIITCVVGVAMGFFLGNHVDHTLVANFSENEYVSEFLKNYEYIVQNYYGEVDSETLMQGALNGMLASLGDDYSTVITSDTFDAQLDGNYEGVGIEIYRTGNAIVILNVFDNSSASNAGLQAGDVIVSIDGIDYSDKSSSEVTSYIQNSKAESFQFEVLRNGEAISVTLQRSNVIIPSIESKTFEKNGKKIGYIYIDIFANATTSQFTEALLSLENEKIDGLIIDVRDNSGGHLTTAIDILSNFLDSKNVIYQTQTKTETKKFYSKGKVTKEYPMVILQNRNSASASELLSICLQEQYGATVIGEVSYGKGTVQELVATGDTEYKFTTKKWLSPNGVWIHEVGVTPDIIVSLDDSYQTQPSEQTDNQLQTALNYLAE